MSYRPRNRQVNRCVLIIRVWQRADEADTWIGEVQDVATGERTVVVGLERVIDLLRQRILALSAQDNQQVSGS